MVIFHFHINLNANKLNLQDRVNGIVASMDNLPFRHEAELYYKYKEFYGYVFYIGKKF
jgi:hypothetical protein